MIIKNKYNLKKQNTFHIGTIAEFFCEAKTIQDLYIALDFARKNKLQIFILGRGRNLLLPDGLFKNLVIKIKIGGLYFNKKEKYTLVTAGAGMDWDYVVAQSIKKGVGGFENLSLIPGTVGGAVYQNIGAYGSELKDLFVSAEILDIKKLEIKKITTKDCAFGYRDSIFQHNEGKNYIILNSTFKLPRDYLFRTSYPDIKNYFADRRNLLTAQELRKAIIKIRKNKLVYPTNTIGTAGSFFKNPIVTSSKFDKIKTKSPQIKGRMTENGSIKLSAGQLIEQVGWKGKKVNNVGVSKKHALVLVNYKNGTSNQIKKLYKSIQKSVKTKFDILLEPEVKIL